MFMEQINVLLSVWVMALALSMDAFSVSLSFGMQNLRLKRIAMIGFIIGALHVVLPLIGMFIGHFVSEQITFITELTSGFIFIALGTHMFFSAMQEKSYNAPPPQGWTIFVVAFFVSIDSFPAGFSIGVMDVGPFMIMITFGCCSMVMAWIGMLLGKKVRATTGRYSEMLGGVIMYFIGLAFIFY